MGSYKQDRLRELRGQLDDLYAEQKSLSAQIGRLNDLLTNSTRGNPGIPGWRQEIKNLRFQRGVIGQSIQDIKRQIEDVKRS